MLHLAEIPHFTMYTAPMPLGEVYVRMPDGGSLVASFRYGRTLADILIAFGIPLRRDRGDAEGHVRIAPDWAARLPSPDDDERRALLRTAHAGPRSRFASHIVMTPALDGLEIDLDAHSLAPQGWVAG